MEKTQILRDYLRTWLERHQKASHIAPAVREALDETEWELGVLRDSPSDAVNISTSQIDEEAGLAFGRITNVLPQMPEYQPPLGFQISSISTTSTSAAFSYVQAVGELGTPAAAKYSSDKSQAYRELQESHQRRSRVRGLMQDIVPAAVDRFDKAHKAVDQCRVGSGAKSAAASEMRNLVDGLQGELFEKARSSPKEKLTWQIMAGRLIPGSGSAAAVMSRQETVRTSLYNDLSQAAKLREGQRGQRVEDLWTRVLDHVFAVLSLVKSGGAV